jgi:hypothetical protein
MLQVFYPFSEVIVIDNWGKYEMKNLLSLKDSVKIKFEKKFDILSGSFVVF